MHAFPFELQATVMLGMQCNAVHSAWLKYATCASRLCILEHEDASVNWFGKVFVELESRASTG